jgi:hypothetical protein
MGESAFRKLVSCVLVISFPALMFAADGGAAMLYTNGTAWVNGAHVPRASSSIFLGDLLQTRSDSVANIKSPGSTITVFSDSLVKFEGSSLQIEHGGVTVATSKGLGTTVGDVRVLPLSSSWTEFNVIDVDGTVRIAARKGDLTVSDGTSTVTLAQGQETTREESSDQSDKDQANKDQSNKGQKKNRKRAAGAAPAATGGALSSPVAVGIGAGAIFGVTAWVLIRNDEPVSPSRP